MSTHKDFKGITIKKDYWRKVKSLALSRGLRSDVHALYDLIDAAMEVEDVSEAELHYIRDELEADVLKERLRDEASAMVSERCEGKDT